MRAYLLAVLCLFTSFAVAQEATPEALVKQVTADVLEAVKTDPALKGGDKSKALKLAEERVLPHIDFREATRLAVGRAWQGATPEQREQLVGGFRTMLVRIYSNAIDVYGGQTMQVQPVRMKPGDTEVTVRNTFRSPGKPPIPVDYQMHKTDRGWKIYDISVEGVSLVITYRGEFEQISRQSGVEGLLKAFETKNAPAKIEKKG